MSDTARRNLILILSVFSASTSCLFARWSTCPSAVLACYRMLLTVGVMTPYMLLRHRSELFRISRRELLLCLVSGVFLGLHFTCYFASVNRTSIAAAQTLTNLEVFFVALFSYLLWKERITPLGWIGIIVIFGGGVIITLNDFGAGNALSGDVLAVLAALTMAIYTMIGRRNRRNMSTLTYTYWVYTASAVTLCLLLLFGGMPFGGYDRVNWLYAFGLMVMCTFLGHSVFSWSLRYFSASHVSTVKLLGPLFCVFLGLVFLGEVPTFVTLLGCLVLIGGTVVYIRSGN